MADGSNKPAYLFLENYILDALGELPDSKAEMTAKLVTRIFKKEGEWKDILREQFGLQPSVDVQLNDMWQEAKKIAKDAKQDLKAEDFAKMVVEENFSDLVELVTTDLVKPASTDDTD